jgi:chromosome segregation ATPase
MQNENYVNYYIETLTSTMTDAIVRNVSLQASNRLHEDIIKEYEKVIGELSNQQNESIESLQNENNRLVDEISSLRQFKSEYENIKHQAQHVDTFRNELIRAREENDVLKKQIDYLQMSPAKRKKYDEQQTQKNFVEEGEINNKNTPYKDGGIF